MERKYYGLNGSQSVSMFERSLSFHKEVINLPFLFQFKRRLDHDLLKKIFNMEVERFDSLRSKIKKVNGKWAQYFVEPYEADILEFDYSGKSAEEERAELIKVSRKPLKLLKGEGYRFVIFTNHSGNTGIFFIVSHTTLDTGGVFQIVLDMIEIYKHFTEGKEMPKAPASFEKSIEKELVKFHDEVRKQASWDFIEGMLKKRGEPLFTAIGGTHHLEKFRKKKKDENIRYTNILIFDNATDQYRGGVSPETTNKTMDYCKEHKVTPHVMFKVAFWAALSKLNFGTDKIIWLTICDGRATMMDQRCAGTKAQSMVEYPEIEFDMTARQAVESVNAMQPLLYANFGNEDAYNEKCIKQTCGQGPLALWHSFITSYVPPLYDPEPGWDIDFEWLCIGRFALPAYIAVSHNMVDLSFDLQYDFQKKISTKESVAKYHELVVKGLELILENDSITMKELIEKL